jgi:preprotein translocase subunit SecE
MARQTRNRRTAPEGAEQPAPAGRTSRAREVQRQRAQRAAVEAKTQAGLRRDRGGARQFLAECVAELKKVDWPGQRQIFTATVVVLIAIFVVGLYLWVADEAFSRLVKNVFLNQ